MKFRDSTAGTSMISHRYCLSSSFGKFFDWSRWKKIDFLFRLSSAVTFLISILRATYPPLLSSVMLKKRGEVDNNRNRLCQTNIVNVAHIVNYDSSMMLKIFKDFFALPKSLFLELKTETLFVHVMRTE